MFVSFKHGIDGNGIHLNEGRTPMIDINVTDEISENILGKE